VRPDRRCVDFGISPLAHCRYLTVASDLEKLAINSPSKIGIFGVFSSVSKRGKARRGKGFGVADLKIDTATSGVFAGSSGIGYNPATGQIIHIPGNNPEAFELIRLGFLSLQVASSVEDAELKQDLLKHSARLVQEGQRILERVVKGAAGKAA
jgi:hypothetical protein